MENSSRSVVALNALFRVEDEGYLILDTFETDNGDWVYGDTCTICDLVICSINFSRHDEGAVEAIEELVYDMPGDIGWSHDTLTHFCAEHEDLLTLLAMKACTL